MSTLENFVGKFKITREIARIANIGTSGKHDNFLTKVVRVLESNIENAKMNKTILSTQFTQTEARLKGSIDDAKQALSDAYLEIDETKISNNADQEKYVNIYLDNIAKKKSLLILLEQSLADAKTELEQKLSDYDASIKMYEEDIPFIAQE